MAKIKNNSVIENYNGINIKKGDNFFTVYVELDKDDRGFFNINEARKYIDNIILSGEYREYDYNNERMYFIRYSGRKLKLKSKKVTEFELEEYEPYSYIEDYD